MIDENCAIDLYILDRSDRRDAWRAAVDSAAVKAGSRFKITTRFLYEVVSKDGWYRATAPSRYLATVLSEPVIIHLSNRLARGEETGNSTFDERLSCAAIEKLMSLYPPSSPLSAAIATGETNFDQVIGAHMGHDLCKFCTSSLNSHIAAVFWSGRHRKSFPWGEKRSSRPDDMRLSSITEVVDKVISRMLALRSHCMHMQRVSGAHIKHYRDYWV